MTGCAPGLVAGRDPGNLFVSRDGRALCPKRLSEKVRGYVEAAGTAKPVMNRAGFAGG
ncbi:hypothetical protein [Sphingomonas sp.]